MALFLKQTDERSKLQSRVDQELREKLQARQNLDMEEPDPAMTEESETTKGIGFIVIFLVLLFVIAGVLGLAFGG